MNGDQTRDFIKRAKTLAKKRKWAAHRLSRELFNQNPYAFARLEKAVREGKGGPPHINVVEAMHRLAELEDEKEKERALA